MIHQIKERWSGKVLFEADATNLRDAVIQAIKECKNLSGADLSGANLYGANLDENKTQSTGNPIFIHPIGSRNDTLSFWPTDKGIYVKTGCFWNTLLQFQKAIKTTHGNNAYAKAYRVAINLAKILLRKKPK